jgi:prolyl oligopeptidase
MLGGMRALVAVVVAVEISSCCPPMQDPDKPRVVTVPERQPVAEPPHAVRPVEPPATPAAPEGPPVARTVDVVDREHGLTLADPYRWMEGVGNAEFTTWLLAQGQHAATELAKPTGRDALHARLRELGLGVSAVFNVQRGGKRLFYNSFPANAQLAKLAVREPDGTSRVLVDPEALSSGNLHVSLNAWSASPDGAHVSYVISRGGGERGELHVLDVKTGKDLPEVIERIWGEGAGAWLPDGKRFFYTQLAVAKDGVDPMFHMVTRLHVLGTAADKDVALLDDTTTTWKLAPEEWPGVWAATGSPWVVATAGGARSEMRVAVAKLAQLDLKGAGKTPWRAVAEYADGVEAAIPHGDRLYLQIYKDAPNRKIVSVPLSAPDLAKARVELAEDPDASLVGMYAARDALYVLHRVEGLARLSRLPWTGGGKAVPLALPASGWIPDIATDLALDGIVFQIETWLAPGVYYRVDGGKALTPVTAGLASTSTADTSALIAEEVQAPAPDGTKIPLSIIRRKDAPLDGARPTIVTGYAAYGVSQSPGFSAARVAWLERGGVAAICHGRGGGEKGRKWQDAGSRENKLVGVRDFIACAQYLVDNHYTSPSHLAGAGRSMGGILVGRAITERPDLFAAVELGVPAVNPLRILAAENGANQKGELGDPATDAGYRGLAEMDPYLHVKSGVAYPAVIFTVGVNDHRVAPWMSGKMAARLRTSTTSKRPVLLRVDEQAGHGIGSTRDQGFAERADVWSFFLAQFGDPAFAAR